MTADEEALRRLLTEHEPDELRGYLMTPSDIPRAEGSGAAFISGGRAATTASGLIIPGSTVPAPTDYVGVYVTLEEYTGSNLEASGWTLEDIIDALTTLYHPREQLILSLALLNRLTTKGKKTLDEIAGYYIPWLSRELAERLRGLLAGEQGRRRALLARQPILATMRHVIVHGEDQGPDPPPKKPLDVHAIMLSHAVSTTLAGDDADERTLEGYSGSLVMELLRVGLLYQSDDIFAAVDRFTRLWLEYGEKLERVYLRAPPRELLRDATGLEIEEILAMGFATVAYSMIWEPGKPPHVRPEFGTVDKDKIERFLKLIADDMEGFKSRFAARSGRFDFLPIQETPVLRAEAGLLVLDQEYLWERITTGLYWVVHDFERDNHGDAARTRWTQAYAEMVERMTEQQIASMAPPILGSAGGKTFYTEENFDAAFGGKQADAGILLGGEFVLFEIVSAQLSVPVRIEGDLDQFEKDTERLIIKKCRQLDSVANALLEDDSRLTGFPKTERLKVLPVVVVGGGYPIHPFTVEYIEGLLRSEGLLSDARIGRLSIVDIGELEILEALAEEGHSVGDLLAAWKGSSLHAVPLKNYVISRFGGDRAFRPSRMRDRVESTFGTIVERLGFSEVPGVG